MHFGPLFATRLPPFPAILFSTMVWLSRYSFIIHLTMNEYDRTEETPSSTLPVDVEHPQNLQEPDTPDRRGSEDLAVAPHWQYHHGRDNHD